MISKYSGRKRSAAAALVAVAFLALSGVGTATALGLGDTCRANAGGKASVLIDPAGDLLMKNAGAFQDFVRAEVSKAGNCLAFRMTLAAPLPPASESSGTFWEWGIDIDAATDPIGFPLPQNQRLPYEFMVFLVSDGAGYFALLVDRRPLLTGGEAVVIRTDGQVNGPTIAVVVASDLLGNPSRFMWRSGVLILRSHVGTQGFQLLDFPDAGFVPWPD